MPPAHQAALQLRRLRILQQLLQLAAVPRLLQLDLGGRGGEYECAWVAWRGAAKCGANRQTAVAQRGWQQRMCAPQRTHGGAAGRRPRPKPRVPPPAVGSTPLLPSTVAAHQQVRGQGHAQRLGVHAVQHAAEELRHGERRV